jgi:hypothetical protein
VVSGVYLQLPISEGDAIYLVSSESANVSMAFLKL